MRMLREREGLTQSYVADRLGVSQAAYCRLERGEIEVTLTKLIALSELYKVPLVELLDAV